MKRLIPTLGLLFAALVCFAQVQGNIPSAASSRVPENLIGQGAARRMGCRSVRWESGLGSMNVTRAPAFPYAPLETVLKGIQASGLSEQVLLGCAVQGGGTIKNLPSQGVLSQYVKVEQAIVDQIDAADPGAVLELSNEADGIAAPFDTMTGEPLWQEMGLAKGSVPAMFFDFFAPAWSQINWRGHRLCIHLVGGGGSAQFACARSWKYRDGGSTPNLGAAAIIALVKNSGGWFAYNTYPNMGFSGSVSGFVSRYVTYTWPNTVNGHKSSPMGGVPCRIGEVGVNASGHSAGFVYSLRQALANALKSQPFTWFAVLSTDPNSYPFNVCNQDGTAVYQDINFR